jgi:hypothetical protein
MTRECAGDDARVRQVMTRECMQCTVLSVRVVGARACSSHAYPTSGRCPYAARMLLCSTRTLLRYSTLRCYATLLVRYYAALLYAARIASATLRYPARTLRASTQPHVPVSRRRAGRSPRQECGAGAGRTCWWTCGRRCSGTCAACRAPCTCRSPTCPRSLPRPSRVAHSPSTCGPRLPLDRAPCGSLRPVSELRLVAGIHASIASLRLRPPLPPPSGP